MIIKGIWYLESRDGVPYVDHLLMCRRGTYISTGSKPKSSNLSYYALELYYLS